MTRNEAPVPGPSIMQEIENDPYEANEIAAARAMNHSLVILHKALAESGMKQSDLAKSLRVGESRVSQVLNGEGNIKVTSLARFLRSMGYEPEFTAKPIDPHKPVISAKTSGARRRRSSSVRVTEKKSVAQTIKEQKVFMDEMDTFLSAGTSSQRVKPMTSYKYEVHTEPLGSGSRGATWTNWKK